MRVVLVTGTDTNVGKTLVTSAIAASLLERGARVGVYKPVETGCERRGATRFGNDCERLRAAAGGRQAAATVSSYLLSAPAAPLVAAEAEGVAIESARIEHDLTAVRSAHDVTLVEGAGGLMVPLSEGVTFLDLARNLALPVLLVVGSRLGCINHALLTLRALEASGVECIGYIVNSIDPATEGPVSPARNRAAIGRFTSAGDLGLFPFVPRERRDDFPFLASLAREKIGTGTIFPNGK